ncbi:MAG: PHB depolymerase family esterase, partial [Rhodomicrobium sp.]|nr:PHB depolymerase family esterase [Rhodomicrobium sp.]
QRLLQGQGVPEQAQSSSNTMAGAPPQPPLEFEGSLSATPRSGLAETLRRLAARAKAAGAGNRGGAGLRPAPDPIPEGASFMTASYSNGAGTRAYKLYVPSSATGQRLPLIVMLHGCTQSPDDFAAGTRMNALAEERTCFVAYPAQAVSANPSKCWNWFTPGNQQRGAGEPSLIAGITRQIMRDYPVDPQRVYAAGLSAGAAAAAIMGMTYPDLYAAIGVHSGLAFGAASDLPSAFAAMRQGEPAVADVLSSLARGADSDLLSMFKAMRPGEPVVFDTPSSSTGGAEDRRAVPTIVFHGDQDTTVHARNGDLVIAQSRATAAMDLCTRVERGRAPGGHAYSRTLHADASGQAILEQWVIHGAGHAWSGGSSAGSFTDPRGPDAAREMLRFFLEHSHPAPRPDGDVTHDAAAAQPGRPARRRKNLKRS